MTSDATTRLLSFLLLVEPWACAQLIPNIIELQLLERNITSALAILEPWSDGLQTSLQVLLRC